MMVKHFPENDAGRDFVVGDLHGRPDLFYGLLQTVRFDIDIDRVFSVGDLIDRGRDSMGALALLDEPWFFAVRGNHEQMLIDVAANPSSGAWRWWIDNGGLWARGLLPSELSEWAARLEALPLAITVGAGDNRFNVLHAEFFGTDANLDAGRFDPRTEERLMWGRTRILNDWSGNDDELLSMTYVGHTVVPQMMTIGSHVYLDTGGVFNGVLSMIEVATGLLYQTVGPDNHRITFPKETEQ